MRGGLTYDAIGKAYSKARNADPAITQRLDAALSVANGRRVLDVGAGTGNYSAALAERGWDVIAVEPSEVMRRQRKIHRRLEWVAGEAEHLPLASHSVGAVVCVSVLHHLRDRPRAFAEMSRVAGSGPVVAFTRDPRLAETCWLEEYFPEVWAESHAAYAPLAKVAEELGTATGAPVRIEAFELPADLNDCFAASGWNRPEMYLEENVRSGMSPFARTAPALVQRGVERLRHDLRTGQWETKYGILRQRTSFHAGYFLLAACR
jgi:ubiquinone/menaquinone biosynthesis C-methylase UbiE